MRGWKVEKEEEGGRTCESGDKEHGPQKVREKVMKMTRRTAESGAFLDPFGAAAGKKKKIPSSDLSFDLTRIYR